METIWVCNDLSHGTDMCPGFCGQCECETHPIMESDLDTIKALTAERDEAKELLCEGYSNYEGDLFDFHKVYWDRVDKFIKGE